jgi:alkylated DNA repair dioxygenase AlkB
MTSASFDSLLPYDGEVLYYKEVIAKQKADEYFSILAESIAWQNDEVVMFGKKITTARKVAWYSPDVSLEYRYAGSLKRPLPFIKELDELMLIAERLSSSHFNACLLNYYHNGSEAMGWHRDNERSIVERSAICSISLGANRRFDFKHIDTGAKTSVLLEHGSALIMKGTTQEYWYHSLAKSLRIKEPRINLTFRLMKS